MAEFQEVVRNLRRMCDFYDDECRTDDCPLYLNNMCYAKAMATVCPSVSKQLEEMVMAWAAEHPEPVYPKWSEWLVDIGVFPKMMSTNPSKALDTIAKAVSQPIPVEIAKKLGLNPKED